VIGIQRNEPDIPNDEFETLLGDEGLPFGTWSATLEIDHCENPATCLSYQRFFLRGLNAETAGKARLAGHSVRLLGKLTQIGVPGSVSALRALGARRGPDASRAGNHVGRYTLSLGPDRRNVRVAIDAEDSGCTLDPDSLMWSDLYFKTNKWSHIVYDPKVRPCVNGNSRLDDKGFATLRALRNTPKKNDLVYWAKLWAPVNRASPVVNAAIIEHQLRVFEALARVPAKTSLLAILPKRLPFVDLDECRHRLEQAGVAWQVGWGDIDTQAFWRGLAEAEIAFLRPGNHHCVSWRMTDLLCMGACVMYEGAPFPQWYAPLICNRHFVHAGCRLGPDFSLPEQRRYDDIPHKIMSLLEKPEMMCRLRESAQDYFERYVHPSAVARYVMAQVRAFADARRQPSVLGRTA